MSWWREQLHFVTPLLCVCVAVDHFHVVISMLLNVSCLPPASPAVKASTFPAQECRLPTGMASRNFRGRLAMHCVEGLQKAPWLEQRDCSEKFPKGI